MTLSEANGEAEESSGTGCDTRGYYADGAYTAIPAVNSRSEDTEVNNEAKADVGSAQDAYRKSILLRYRLLRANLHMPPPAEALNALDEDHSFAFCGPARTQYPLWLYRIRETDPLPAQLAAMDRATVLKLIGLITTGLMKRFTNIEHRISKWIWALLGRLEELGCLTNDAVSVVRDLGKRAAWVLRGAQDAEERHYDGNHADEELEADRESPCDETAGGEDVEVGAGAASGNIVVTNTTDYGSPERIGDAYPSTSDGALSCVQQRPLAEQDAERENKEEEDESTVVGEAKELAPPPAIVTSLDQPDSGNEHSEEGEISSSPFSEPYQKMAKDDAGENNGDVAEEGKEDEEFLSTETLATLDMILTIVGEMYGQRDLLTWRENWT